MPYSVDRNAKPGETKPKPAPAPIVKEVEPVKGGVQRAPSSGGGTFAHPDLKPRTPIGAVPPKKKKQHVRYQMDSETSKRLRVSGGKRGT